jgi:long-chain-fatty-acid--[acyl-carrier-protein] ligase
VGLPFPGLEICIIHPEKGIPLSKGNPGEVCIFGPTVFKGYLSNEKDPFIELGGKKWYRSGDLGYLDEAGNLHISGRIKRFTKVGGEMISLTALEEELTKYIASQQTDNDSTVAIVAEDMNGDTPQLIAFSAAPLDKDLANKLLKDAGFSNLIKISSVKRVEKIPLLGTGKINYLSLRTQQQADIRYVSS